MFEWGKKLFIWIAKLKILDKYGKNTIWQQKQMLTIKMNSFQKKTVGVFFTHVQLWALQAVNLKDVQQRLYVVLNLVAIKGVPQDPQAFWYGMCQNYTDLKADSQVLNWADCAVIFHKWHLLSNNYKFLGHAG